MPFPTPGQPFGRYLVEILLARGGMGAVYRALDTETGKHVAIKVLREDKLGDDEDDAARFLREGRIVSKLKHPNIVTIHEVGEVGGVPFLAMEWVDGLPLSEAMGGLSLEGKQRILLEIAEALSFAHEHAIVHRDVKPANVLVDADGRSKLVDFGIARHAAPSLDPATFETRANMILGTPSYMAPEQMASSKVTAAADQFAWSVLAYEMLTGSHPRDVVPGFPFQPAHTDFWKTDVPAPLGKVVRRAATLDPALRFESMKGVVDAWREAMAGGDGETLKTFAHGTPAERDPFRGPAQTRSPARRLAALGATLLLAASASVFFVVGSHTRTATTASDGASVAIERGVPAVQPLEAKAPDLETADASAAILHEPRAAVTAGASVRAVRRPTTRPAASTNGNTSASPEDPLKDIERR